MSESVYREASVLQEGQLVLIKDCQTCAVVTEVLPTLVFVRPVGLTDTVLCIRSHVKPVTALQGLASQALSTESSKISRPEKQ